MRYFPGLLIVTMVLTTMEANSQTAAKIISECTIVYNLSLEDANSSPELMNALNGSTKTVYIKGSKSRTDLNTSSYTLSIINDARSDSTVVLRVLGNTRYMTFLNEAKKREKNKKFEGIVFTNTGSTKTILGYECVNAVAKLQDGSTYNVFYAPSVVPSNREYEYQFKDLPGLALEYETESEDGKQKVKYTAVKIVLTPVQASKFDLPKSGYRVL